MAEDTQSISLPARLEISGAAELREVLNASLVAGGTVVLNAEQVNRVDGSGAQLLYAFVRQSRQVGVELRWSNVSEPLRQSLTHLGLLHEFGLTT